MIDINDVRERDLDNGVFDIYIDDIGFSMESLQRLAASNIARISDINPYDVEDGFVFDKMKEVTNYLKSVADEMFKGRGYSVLDHSIDSYVKLIIKAKNDQFNLLDNISSSKFFEREILQIVLIRDVFVRYAKYMKNIEKGSGEDVEAVKYSYGTELENLKIYFEQRKNGSGFKNNLSVKPANRDDV